MPIPRNLFDAGAPKSQDGNSDGGHDHHNDGVHRIDHVLNTPGFGPIADAITYDAARAYLEQQTHRHDEGETRDEQGPSPA